MIDIAYVRLMARYNRWQNESLYGAADGLADEERRRERGAFFGSIQGTLSHLLWADCIWMSRFAGLPKPKGGIKDSPSQYPHWAELKRERAVFDDTIAGWADRLDPAWLSGDMTWYSGAAKAELTRPKAAPRRSFLQPPDPSPGSGPLHADASGRETRRHRPDGHAGLKRADSAGDAIRPPQSLTLLKKG